MATEKTNIYQLIEHQAKTLGDKPFILFNDTVVSFSETYEMTCRAANGFIAQGARQGDGVAILMKNCPEYLYFVYGVPRAGLYSVPVNTSLEGDELRYILTHADVRFLIVDDTLYPRIAELRLPVGTIEKVFVRRTEIGDLPPGLSDISLLLEGTSQKPGYPISDNDISAILYTSGTTSFPKGVVHRNRSSSRSEFFDLVDRCLLPDDVLFTVLPLHHSNALKITFGMALAAGIPFGLEKHFDPSSFWHRVQHYGATVFNGLAGMLPNLLKQPQGNDDSDNTIRLVLSSGCPANTWEQFESRFGVTVWEIYSAVDIGGVMTLNSGNAPVGSVGKPINAEWHLVDEDGRDVPQGDCGELIVRNLDLSRGTVEYYKDLNTSREKIRNGWVHTGDMFYTDKNGNLYFVDRKQDSIKLSGFSEEISSTTIENAVMSYSGIEACAAGAVKTDDQTQ
ncbi:MAG: AMP-binding protein, partial [Deltaproteobacteria bacterium]|nr:AMP-binding protein [Deltaproteobacteria bacterium]